MTAKWRTLLASVGLVHTVGLHLPLARPRHWTLLSASAGAGGVAGNMSIPPADGMLVYGLPVDGDGRIDVSSGQLASRLARLRDRESENMPPTEDDECLASPPEPVQLQGHELKARTVQVGSTMKLNLTVWEVDKPQDMLESWMMEEAPQEGDLDPFGVVLWPGAQLVATALVERRAWMEAHKARVLVLGAGTGLEAFAAAHCEAEQVTATDTNELPLALLALGAERQGLAVGTQLLDIMGPEPLPECDLLVAADVIYNRQLAQGLAHRVLEAWTAGAAVLVADSQGFHANEFRELVAQGWDEARNNRTWTAKKIEDEQALATPPNLAEVRMRKVTGSGLLIESDLEYDITVRCLSVPGKLAEAPVLDQTLVQ